MKSKTFQLLTILADILILGVSFLFWIWIKPGSKRYYLPTHLDFFIILAILWIFISLITGKLHRGKIINIKSLVYRTILSNTISLSVAVFLLFTFQQFGYSRMVILGTAGVATVLEILCGICYMAVVKAVVQDYQPLSEYRILKKLTEHEMVGQVETNEVSDEVINEVPNEVIESLQQEIGQDLATGILNIAGGKLNGRSHILSTTTPFNITSLPEKDYSYIINLHRINDIRDLNRFLEAVNKKVKVEGYFLCCVETKDLRKKRILKKYPPVINWIYYFFDFIVKRVLPKTRVTKGVYQFLTRGNNVVISRAEALGRLSRAGFRIANESFINNLLFIEARKCSDPVEINGKNYGILITLPRIGRNGELINVYKMRTMHPYSEYIQDYVYSLHDLQEGGKFKNDFRITSWGAVCRQIWLDELPMFINFFRGEMKLVGIRPLSKQYFDLYSEELRNLRVKFKPGLIPPFYYDMPANLEEIQASELKYLESYLKHPLRTDIRYFFRSFRNIIFSYARSN